ncbi:MAG: HSP20 family protein [Candidatus Berkelbacteria bacterium Athens1014_28]|uniref:HSP20 family protein n=1 Tax=Candidatus Berkelbacteria bacterium Athens1014_28 TaxID=2017145 RepID=A0A554LJB1_9BACT|nr:MAG: HSP20 family protein [Candidatus Berkelbacteria bacterium Athens1014_28]
MKNKEHKIENKIKDLRKQQKLSQEEVAEALGVSRQSIIALEHGRYMPSLPIAVSLCDLFDSAFEEIFQFEHETKKIVENISNNVLRKEATMPLELEPWRPFREMVTLRDAMDRLFEDSVVTPKTAGMPKIDIKETKDDVRVKAELPGIPEEEVNVEITDNVMTISGEKKLETKDEGEGYYYKESHSGAFSRSFMLPSDVIAEKAEAEMKHGVLTIVVPKVEEKKPKKVTIKTKSAK